MSHFAIGLLTLVLGTAVACSQEAPKQKAMPAPLVTVITVEERNVPTENIYVGQTEGSKSVEVRAQVSGLLMSRAYEEGAYVQQGQLLFEIEPDTYKANLAKAQGVMAQAQAKVTQSKQDLDRVLPLYAKNAVSQRDRDEAQASFNSAKADLDSAVAAVDESQIKLNYAYVTAPISGYTSREQRSVGNLISAGNGNESLLTVINNVDPIYASFSIPSPHLMRLRTLQAQGRIDLGSMVAELYLADNSLYPVKGIVNFIDTFVNPNTSVVAARAEFANKKLTVMPGQFVRIKLTGATLLNAIIIPQKAILQTQKGPMVVVINDQNLAEMRSIVTRDSYGGGFMVESGLKSGERIVNEGANKVTPGQVVQIATPAAAPEPKS